MCFSQKTPKIPDAEKPPTRADESKQATRSVRDQTAEQTGQYGNIFTSALGDAGYGTAAAKQVKLGTAGAA